MANQEQLELLKQGTADWNTWRRQHPEIRLDLSGADLSEGHLSGATLSGANFYRADLSRADLSEGHLSGVTLFGAKLYQANLRGADLSGADLQRAHLRGADLRGADLSGADLSGVGLRGADLKGTTLLGARLYQADLSGAILRGADLSGADLKRAHLIGADLSGANLSGADLNGANLSKASIIDCHVYGTSTWKVILDETKQTNLVITTGDGPIITVDNIKVAQFIYLLLDNRELREVIDTLTTKAVLILGRFNPERKAILDALREALRSRGYLPILINFLKPASLGLTETISTLANVSRFIIADLTDAKSIPQELAVIVPNLPDVPVQPLLASSDREYAMFEHFIRYPWVLPDFQYGSQAELLANLEMKVIVPAEAKAKTQVPRADSFREVARVLTEDESRLDITQERPALPPPDREALSSESKAAMRLFCSYSHKDERHRRALEPYLSHLQRDGFINRWSDQQISPGQEWDNAIQENLETADIVLLLVSQDFLASPYAYEKEMVRAIQRHDRDQARVIPVILRPSDWRSAPLAKLQALPPDAKPISRWNDRDEAWLAVVQGIRKAVQELREARA